MWHLLTKGHFKKYKVVGYDRYGFDILEYTCTRCEHE